MQNQYLLYIMIIIKIYVHTVCYTVPRSMAKMPLCLIRRPVHFFKCFFFFFNASSRIGIGDLFLKVIEIGENVVIIFNNFLVTSSKVLTRTIRYRNSIK